jgi:hypothetical protein
LFPFAPEKQVCFFFVPNIFGPNLFDPLRSKKIGNKLFCVLIRYQNNRRTKASFHFRFDIVDIAKNMAVLYILTPLLESACDAFDSNLLIPSQSWATHTYPNSILEFLHTNAQMRAELHYLCFHLLFRKRYIDQ